MFGKLGRGGGGGAAGRGGGGKRPLPPAQLHRPGALGRGGAAASRPGRGVPSAAASSAAGGAVKEETFSLSSGAPLDFAAIIRLTPDIVEEIRRLEEHGGTPRIRFDANSINAAGNLIDVGGREFRFTWAREPGDLCDIYEERRNGEDGNGLLVERGSAWRKLTVQRILDESTKNHVKMRSEEAERQLKSRKAIVLDPANPSVKNQAKTMAAAGVEGNMRRMGWKQKKEPFPKKRRVETNSVPNIGPPKSIFKSGTSSNKSTKGMLSVSPLPSPPEQPVHCTLTSPIETGNSSRFDLNTEEIIAPISIHKEVIDINDKETPSMVTQGAMSHKMSIASQAHDLQSFLITLLSEKPNGMSLKALEKAVGEKMPEAVKKIESIIKNIATFQAPGRYFLKPGVEVESSKRRASESGSSPESANGNASAKAVEKVINDIVGRFDAGQDNPDPFASNIKVSNESEGRACSSSESGSDSDTDSDSTDSGSDSGSQSRSKSKSPAGSASASSSDSDSDGSSSSKEGSDVDVDIMTSDDEREATEHGTGEARTKVSVIPSKERSGINEHEQIDILGCDQDGEDAPSPIDLNILNKDAEAGHPTEIERDFPKVGSVKNPETEIGRQPLDHSQSNSRFTEEGITSSPDQQKQTELHRTSYAKTSVIGMNEQCMKESTSGKPMVLKGRNPIDHSAISGKVSKIKTKRVPEQDCFQENQEGAKRAKAASLAQTMNFGRSENSLSDVHYKSPDRRKQEKPKNRNVLAANTVKLAGPNDKMEHSPDSQSTSTLDPEKSGPRTGYPVGRRKVEDSVYNVSVNVEDVTRGNKASDMVSVHPDESAAPIKKSAEEKLSLPKNKQHKDMRDENGDLSDKYLARHARESVAGDKMLSTPDPYSKKSGEPRGASKDVGRLSQKGKYDVENSSVNGRGAALRRELSDLELGEFREPLAGEDNMGVKRPLERKASFKLLDNKIDNANVNINKERGTANSVPELKRPPSPGSKVGYQSNQDRYRRTPEEDFVESTRPKPQQRLIASQSLPFSKVHADSEFVSRLDKSAEVVGRVEMKKPEGLSLDNHADECRQNTANPLHDNKHGGELSYKTVDEHKPQKASAVRDTTGQTNNGFMMEHNSNTQKRREPSSDEADFFYAKYDKCEPELKGPIKHYHQYKEYVQEYRGKYGTYCSLNTNLENIRNDFLKLGHDLELSKGRDSDEYYNLLEKLKEMYDQHGAKHKQMKRVFVLLHEELKNLKQRIIEFADNYSKE